ncbi:MAG: OmpH family outer membrane protein [Isosphaeraceae bacterium]
MLVSSRRFVTLGTTLTVALSTAAVAFAQGAAQDSGVRKTAGQTGAAAPTPKLAAPVPPVFGTVDIETVFKNYDKVKVQQEEFKARAEAKSKELMKIQAEAQESMAKLAKMTPNSVDAKKIEDHITQLKAQLEAGREQAQRDFAMQESEMLATLYKEVQDMVRRIAEYRGMTYVVQVSNEPVAGSNPNSVMAAMARTVVYADPRNDITKDVYYNLNRAYQAAGGTAPRAAAPAAAATPRTTPSGN